MEADLPLILGSFLGEKWPFNETAHWALGEKTLFAPTARRIGFHVL
ncbi:MAG: hypothetical protein IPH75_12230 [bacterium]|nr:hypothetical protein [bacterium]